jgi:hypothetical protein
MADTVAVHRERLRHRGEAPELLQDPERARLLVLGRLADVPHR